MEKFIVGLLAGSLLFTACTYMFDNNTYETVEVKESIEVEKDVPWVSDEYIAEGNYNNLTNEYFEN